MYSSHLSALIGIVAIAMAAPGGDFESADAKIAKIRFEKEKKTLDDSYAKEIKTISRTYIAALNAARKTALEANNLDEAQAISTEIREIDEKAQSAELPDPATPSTTKLTAKDVAGRQFCYRNTPSTFIMILDKDGSVKGADIKFERSWKVTKDGKLLLADKDGNLCQVFDGVYRSRNGICLQGRTQGPSSLYSYLTELEAPAKKK